MARIIIFRHGQTFYNRDKIFTGWKDSRLTELGKQQAREIGKLMAKIKFDIAYTSRLSRAKETLKIALGNQRVKTIVDDRMIERNYGSLSGKHHDSTIEKYGKVQFGKWHRGWNERPPEGESFADVEKRVRSFIGDLQKKYGGKEINIVISAHGNSIRLFRKIMENASVEETCGWTIPYDSYFEYQI